MLYPATGRPPVPYEALLKAFVYKNIKNISYFSDLARELQDYPIYVYCLVFILFGYLM